MGNLSMSSQQPCYTLIIDPILQTGKHRPEAVKLFPTPRSQEERELGRAPGLSEGLTSSSPPRPYSTSSTRTPLAP